MSSFGLFCALLALGSTSAYADQASCDRIHAANVKTGSAPVTMKTTGYDFTMDTAGIYGSGRHTCSYLRDEAVNGEASAVYSETYKTSAGTTIATIWISKSSGATLREEEDGDIVGKGKGHIAYQWTIPKH